MKKKAGDTGDVIKKKESIRKKYVLCLYVAGASPHSVKAIDNLKFICEKHLQNNYSLEIIDVYKHAALAREAQIIALPLLIKKLPLPERKMIGDMSDFEKVLKGLGVK